MIVEAPPKTEEVETQPYAYMRPAVLDQRDTAIVLAVAKRWADSGPTTYREIAQDIGGNTSPIHFRISGRQFGAEYGGGIARHKGGGLIENGWIAQENNGHNNRTIRPGPRFAGFDRKRGIVYEWLHE